MAAGGEADRWLRGPARFPQHLPTAHCLGRLPDAQLGQRWVGIFFRPLFPKAMGTQGTHLGPSSAPQTLKQPPPLYTHCSIWQDVQAHLPEPA